jgi:hypothetical protein
LSKGRFGLLTKFATQHTSGRSRIVHRMLPGVLALVIFALAFPTPAGAITINGVDYVFLGNKRIGMEAAPFITGNVGVADPTAFWTSGRASHHRTGAGAQDRRGPGRALDGASDIRLSALRDVVVAVRAIRGVASGTPWWTRASTQRRRHRGERYAGLGPDAGDVSVASARSQPTRGELPGPRPHRRPGATIDAPARPRPS